MLSRHVERGPKRFRLADFTYAELAEGLDMTEGALRTAVSRDQVDPTSVQSIVRFAVQRGRRLEEASLRDLVGEARTLIEEE